MENNFRNNIVLSGGVVDLDRYIGEYDIVIKSDTVVNAINNHNNMNIRFKVEKGVSLLLNMFDYAVDLVQKIEVELDDEASFIMNAAFISEVKYDLTIDTKMYGNDTYSEVNIRGINEERGTVKIIMNGTVAGETHGSEINEYARIINKSEQSSVLIPNLVVNTSEVVANHGVSVTGLDEEKLFYLMSKGIDRTHASKILEEGFILSIMSDDVKEHIKNILVGR